MEQRQFGFTGLKVSVIGFGAGHIDENDTNEKSVEKLLNSAVDMGITLFDTARVMGLQKKG